MRGREPGFLNRPTVPARSRRHKQASTKKLKQEFTQGQINIWSWASTSSTHHGTSPNSGMYLLGKFSRGTPKTFDPLMNSLSLLFSKLLTVIPWRTWRWNRITFLSVTFMVWWEDKNNAAAQQCMSKMYCAHQYHLWLQMRNWRESDAFRSPGKYEWFGLSN